MNDDATLFDTSGVDEEREANQAIQDDATTQAEFVDPPIESQAIATLDPSQLLAIAVQKNFDIDKLRELMTLEREWRADRARSLYAEAMARFGEIKRVVSHNRTGTTAGNAKFTYADFPTMVKAVTPWLTECGLSFSHRQDPPAMAENKVGFVIVHCRIIHTAGHYEEFDYPAVPDGRLDGKVSPSQLIQLAITYAKRQTLAMGLGLATSEDKDDDDSHGNMRELITVTQVAHLREAIEDTKTDTAKFLTFMKADKIEEIRLTDYGKAIKALEEKRKGVVKSS